jgi:hypothetical protein
MKRIDNQAICINSEMFYFSFLLSFVKIVFGGYAFGRSDLTAHLLPIFRRMDSSFLVNDFFTNHSLNFGPTYYFSIIMASILRPKHCHFRWEFNFIPSNGHFNYDHFGCIES